MDHTEDRTATNPNQVLFVQNIEDAICPRITILSYLQGIFKLIVLPSLPTAS